MNENEREKMKDIVIEFLKVVQLTYTSLSITEKENNICIDIIPDKDLTSLYIGYRGGNLNALQHILKSVLWGRFIPKDRFLLLDIDGYREKNDQKVISIAQDKIAMVKETGIPQTMPFLTAGDRRMVHLLVRENYADSIDSESFTNEEGRRIIKITQKHSETSELEEQDLIEQDLIESES